MVENLLSEKYAETHRETFTKTEICKETFTKTEICKETFTKTRIRKEACNSCQATPGSESAWAESPNAKTSLMDASKAIESTDTECSNASENRASSCVQNEANDSNPILGFIILCMAACIVCAWNFFVPAAQMNIADGTNLIVNMRQFFGSTLAAAGGIITSSCRTYLKNKE